MCTAHACARATRALYLRAVVDRWQSMRRCHMKQVNNVASTTEETTVLIRDSSSGTLRRTCTLHVSQIYQQLWGPFILLMVTNADARQNGAAGCAAAIGGAATATADGAIAAACYKKGLAEVGCGSR